MKKEAKQTWFDVSGSIGQNEEKKPFSKRIHAFSAAHAKEKTLSLFGSKNRLTRRNVSIAQAKPAEEKKE